MRTRKEIEKDISVWDAFKYINNDTTIRHNTQLMLEILLDIRELLEKAQKK